MNIGIDIDDTLTDMKIEMGNNLKEYLIKIGKTKEYEVDELDKNDGRLLQKRYNLTYEELKYFLGTIQESFTNTVLPRDNAVQVINKLKESGHKITIITARDEEFHDDPYSQSKTWLLKNNIVFDKLIVNARDKATICKNENVDILIDDSLNNCTVVSEVGIKTLRVVSNSEVADNLNTFNDWNEIYLGILDYENS